MRHAQQDAQRGLVGRTDDADHLAVDTHGGEVISSANALATYTELFEFLMYVGVGVGVFVLLVSPLLRRGMHGIH